MICKTSLVGLPDVRTILKRLPIKFKLWRWSIIKILINSFGDYLLVLPEALVPVEHIGFFRSLFSSTNPWAASRWRSCPVTASRLSGWINVLSISMIYWVTAWACSLLMAFCLLRFLEMRDFVLTLLRFCCSKILSSHRILLTRPWNLSDHCAVQEQEWTWKDRILILDIHGCGR
jgi:hypothetical protein